MDRELKVIRQHFLGAECHSVQCSNFFGDGLLTLGLYTEAETARILKL